MLSERALTTVLSVLNKSYLKTEPVELDAYPAPKEGHGYTLYAHVPFCERLCTYCSFNRFLYEEERTRAYFKRLRVELHRIADLGYDFPSLYIGGGTPTILLDELCATIDLARELFPGITEVSTETSPNHLNDELIDALSGRVQRLSCGAQSFDDDLLREMDRYAKYGDGMATFEKFCSVAGTFPSFNIDMIFNFPKQTEKTLQRDIELLKATGCNQTTFYPLMASPLRRRQMRENIGKIDYKREKYYYDIVTESLKPEFQSTSAWTFSKDPDAMVDEYIVNYPEYVGIGSGSQSFHDGVMYTSTFSLSEYMQRVDAGHCTIVKRGKTYSKKAQMRYRFVTDLFGLRLDKKRFRRDFGMPVELALPVELAFMAAVGGIAKNDADEILLTDMGRYMVLVMMRETLAVSNDTRDRARSELPLAERLLLLEGIEHPAVQQCADCA